jgi:hypothetical protein
LAREYLCCRSSSALRPSPDGDCGKGRYSAASIDRRRQGADASSKIEWAVQIGIHPRFSGDLQKNSIVLITSLGAHEM